MALSKKNKIITINKEIFGTLALIKNGILGKFTHLMDKNETKEVLEKKSLEGHFTPYPFVFAPYGEENQNIIKNLKKDDIVFLNLDNEIVGKIKVSSIFLNENPDKSIFKAKETLLNNKLKLGNLAISGEFELFFDEAKILKETIKQKIKNQDCKRVGSMFLMADPLNRLHERIIRLILDRNDLVIIFLVQTINCDGRLNFELRKKSLEFLINNFLPKDKIIIAPLPNIYLFSDHLNPILELVAAKNLGANEVVVGQGHKGIGTYIKDNKINTILDNYSKTLDIKLAALPEFVYCNECHTIVSIKTCPHGAHHHIRYRSSIIKELLFSGIMPPAIIVRKEISAIILDELFPNRFSNLQEIFDEIFPNEGIIEEHNQKDFYKELMNLYQTSSLN